jgi:hypothetical protein
MVRARKMGAFPRGFTIGNRAAMTSNAFRMNSANPVSIVRIPAKPNGIPG